MPMTLRFVVVPLTVPGLALAGVTTVGGEAATLTEALACTVPEAAVTIAEPLPELGAA